MRAKLERIAAGKIEFDKPVVTLSDSIITLGCAPGEKAEGSFTLTADRPVKGVVYASTSRMTLEHASFHGRTARVFCSFDARGFWGGEEIEGEFCIVTEAGEFHLPYTVRVEPRQEPEEESYAYFVSADPIAPLPEEQKKEEQPEESVVEVTGGTEEKLTPEEAGKFAEQILKGNRPGGQGLARLKNAYHAYGSKEMLSFVCSAFIKNGITDEESFFWYKRGVQAELKITNLYEYFMMALPENYSEPFPKNLLLYFQMENTLSASLKAALYANIIRFQAQDSDIYRAYREQIEDFMLDELVRRSLSEDLAVIYDRFLVEELLTIDFAEALADIMFLRRIRCRDRRIRQVQVLYEQLQKRITVPLIDGKALIPIYTPGAMIVLVDDQGNCYTSSVPYTLNRLLDEKKYVKRCRELLRYHQGLYLYLCDGTSRYHVLTADNVENYKRILKISGFTAAYKENVRQEILQFYYASHELDELDQEFFVTETASMNPKDRAKYTEILILRGMYEEAWSMIWRHGYDNVIQFDADGQHRPEHLADLVEFQRSTGSDIVIGSRFVTKSKPHSLRMAGSNLISFIIRLTCGVTIKDPTSGMRLYNRRMIEQFATRTDLAPEPDTLAFLIKKKNATVGECQVEMRERMAGESYLTLSKSVSYMANACVSILFAMWFKN